MLGCKMMPIIIITKLPRTVIPLVKLLLFQLSKLIGVSFETFQPLFTEEDCWNFFSENMAPATSTKCDEGKDTGPYTEDSGSLIQSFIGALAGKVQDMDTNRVYMTRYYTNQYNIIIL